MAQFSLQGQPGRLYSTQAATADEDVQAAYVPPEGAKVGSLQFAFQIIFFPVPGHPGVIIFFSQQKGLFSAFVDVQLCI